MDEKEPETLSPEETAEPNLTDELLVYMDGFRNEIEERFGKLTDKVSLLQELFVKRVKDDQLRQKAFDELHEQLQDYKRNFVAESQKPFLKSLLLLYDTILRQEETEKGAIGVIKEELLEVLHRQGVELMREEPKTFDRDTQMAVETKNTKKKSEDQTVVRVVRHGFRMGEHILRPQEVVIKKYSK